MAQTPQVAVIGMKALSRDLAKLTSDSGSLYKALAAAGATAVEPVADATRSRLPQVTGRLAGDVRVTSSRSGAAVRMGRSSLRYAGWVEFGGTRRAPQLSTRAYQSRGRYMFPAAMELAGRSAALYGQAVERAVADFPWTNTGADPHD